MRVSVFKSGGLVRPEVIRGGMSLIVEHRFTFYKRSLSLPPPLPPQKYSQGTMNSNTLTYTIGSFQIEKGISKPVFFKRLY